MTIHPRVMKWSRILKSIRTITSVVLIIASASAAEPVPSLDEEFDHPPLEVRPSGYW
jgi:hypothetical protein